MNIHVRDMRGLAVMVFLLGSIVGASAEEQSATVHEKRTGWSCSVHLRPFQNLSAAELKTAVLGFLCSAPSADFETAIINILWASGIAHFIIPWSGLGFSETALALFAGNRLRYFVHRSGSTHPWWTSAVIGALLASMTRVELKCDKREVRASGRGVG